MVDFAQGKQQQIERLHRQTEIQVTQEEQKQIESFKPQHAEYDDKFIVSQIENQKDFYSDYKRKWNNDYAGLKVYRAEIPDQQEIQVQNDNLWYWKRKTRRAEATANEETWKRKMTTVMGLEKNPFGLKLAAKHDTYAYDLMKGTLKYIRIEKRKREIQKEILGKDESMNPLIKAYKKEFLALAPEIKINANDLTENYTFDQDSVEAYEEYLREAIANPVQTLKNAVTDAINSLETLSPKLFGRHAIPQYFEVIKQLRDRFEAITSLVSKASGASDEIKAMMSEAINKVDEEGKLVDKANFDFAAMLFKAIDGDLRYSLHHYGIEYKDNGLLVTDSQHVVAGYDDYKGEGTQILLKDQLKKQTRGTHRTNNAYWREQSRELIKKEPVKNENEDENDDDNENVQAGEEEVKILKSIKILEDKVDRNADEGNKGELFDRISENAKKIASAITEIDKELADSADVFERREKEIKSRPILKRKLKIYIEQRKQEMFDLIDRAGGYINALRSLALGEELSVLGKQILMENQMTVISNNLVVEDENEEKQREDNLFNEEAEKMDGFVVVGNTSVTAPESGVTQTLSAVGRSLMPFSYIKKKLIAGLGDANDQQSTKLRTHLNAPLAESYYKMMLIEGKDINKMDTEQINRTFDEYGQNAQVLIDKTKKVIVSAFKDIDAKYQKYAEGNINQLSRKEVNKLIKDTAALRDKFILMNDVLKMQNGVKYTIDNTIPQEDKDHYKDLQQAASLKFKILCDKIDQYKYSNIVQRIKNGDTSSDMYNLEDKAYIDNMLKGLKTKNGKYKDGKSPEMLIVEYFEKKKEGAAVSRAAHAKEYGLFLAKLMEQDAKKEEQAFLPEDERQEVQNKKSISQLMQIPEEEEIHEEEQEDNIHENIIHEEEQEQHEEDPQQMQERINQNKEQRANRARLKDEEFERFNEDYTPVILQKFTNNSKDSKIQAKKFFVNCLLIKNISTFTSDEKLRLNKNSNTKMRKTLTTMYSKLKDGEFERRIFRDGLGGMPNNPKMKSIAVAQDNKDFLWLVAQIDKLEDVNSENVTKLKEDWQKRAKYLEDNNEIIDPIVYQKGLAVLISFMDAVSAEEGKEKKEKIKKSIDKYQPGVIKAVNLLDSPDFKIARKLNADGYRFDQHQQGDNRCWAASHTYVVNTYMDIHQNEINEELKDKENLKPQKFTQDTFWTEDNHKINEKVQQKMTELKNNNDDSVLDYEGEALNIKNFLTKDRMGNAYSIADTVITRIPKTAERHFVFSRPYNGGVDLNQAQKTKLGKFLMAKISKELDRTQTPISLLKGFHYYSIVGVDPESGTLQCFNSNYDGNNLQKIDHISVNDLISSTRFELIFPEYLSNENLEIIKEEFGFEDDLYDEQGDLKMNDRTNKEETDHLDNPTYMMHKHGIDIDKPENKKQDFENEFFNEQIYLPKNLNLPKKLSANQ